MKTELEKHLLTRSYDDQERIEELLETRYSLTGSQRPTLVLLPTGHDETPKTKSLLHRDDTIDDEQFNKRKINTRLEVREFLKSTINSQKKVIKKVQEHKRSKNPGDSAGKPFNVVKVLNHYKIPLFEDFMPMRSLWEKYAQNLVFPDVKSPESKIPAKQAMLSKLASAEYTGCFMRVLESRNKNFVGVEGIVAYDTQYSFILCLPRDEDPDAPPSKQVGGLRIIPKRYTLFSFDIPLPNTTELKEHTYVSFTLIGSRIEYRSVDRSTKKFKNHNVDDIL